MAATFNPSLATPLDRVRQALGDTDPARAAVPDETISYYLTAGNSEKSTAAQLAQDLAAKYAAKVDTTVDGQSKKYSDLMKHYNTLAARLRLEAGAEPSGNATVSGGGVMVFGATSEEVYAARGDPTKAANAIPWYPVR